MHPPAPIASDRRVRASSTRACIRAALLVLPPLVGALLAASSAEAQRRGASANSVAPTNRYETVMTAEQIARGPCEAKPGRVFVAHELGSECIAYFVEGRATEKRTVFFLDGDVPPELVKKRGALAKYLSTARRFMAARARAHGVRYVFVARPGVHGSSGNHGIAKSAQEVYTINAAVDAIKERLGLERISLAGQSGGSTVAAGMLTLGRDDVECAVLASGGFDMATLLARVAGARVSGEQLQNLVTRLGRHYYNVTAKTPHVLASPRRRVYVVGDTRDKRTPFDLQQRYAEAMRAAGHHAVLLTAKARDSEHHGLTAAALELAGKCAAGGQEKALRAVLRRG
jgi:pimeloyl-ACP methyl ester carboxylesterase